MLRKTFHIGKSETKSRLLFAIPEAGSHRNLKRSLFRDPAAVPMLQDIARALEGQGYEVTDPKPGKSCHAFFYVALPNVKITVVLLVRRRKRKIEFDIITWPAQTLRQRIAFGTMKSPDCPEWAKLCSEIHAFLATDQRLVSLDLRTFARAE